MNRNDSWYLRSMPRIYSKIREFRTLGLTFDDLRAKALEIVQEIEDEQYIMTASSYGLEQEEKVYSIESSPDESIEFRRRRLLQRKRERVPFNMAYLRKALADLTGDLTYSEMDYALQVLHVDVAAPGAEYWEAVWEMLERVTPQVVEINAAVVVLHEALKIISENYGFDVQYRYTGQFSAEAVDGRGKLLMKLMQETEEYGFDIQYQYTGQFTPTASFGAISDAIGFSQMTSPYGFYPIYKETGNFYTGG